ncbi:MAG: M1 family metallopeptidase [Cyclobacteriaceae bacterium]|nr:M1 family metallopeptidase [Cyclobacteriaceae bacterium]
MTKRSYFTIAVLNFAMLFSEAQDYRWQQKVDYTMEVDMDVTTHQFTGTQNLIYTNNSPDTLHRIFYHLYFNAFQPGSMMDVRSRNIKDPDPRVNHRIGNLKAHEIGYLKVNKLLQDGLEAEYHTSGTILEVDLAKPLTPKQSTTLNMNFTGQVPLQIRRSGRDNGEGIAYSMSQWYPKLAEYDHRGWHANPYIAREFHGVWGNFDVKLSIDQDYTVAGTGYLQNAQQIGHGYAENAHPRPHQGKLTWHFKAPNVHDFMWAADPDYRHVQAQVPDGPTLHFFYQPGKETAHWEELPHYTIRAFQYVNEHFGKYPYDQYSVIQGGDGGMEYPMATLITGHRPLSSLVGVTVHELLHSWYQMVLGTNESLYAWMDEGFTSFATAEVTAHLFGKHANPHNQVRHYNSYYHIVRSGIEEPLTTHADHFLHNQAYSVAAYSKGSVFLRQLSYIIGEEAFSQGLLRYYNQWKFRHPEPNDFKRVMEKISGLELDWYLEYWINTTKSIDYGIESISYQDDSTYVTLVRYGDMIMPVDLAVKFEDGTKAIYHIPLRIMRGSKSQEIIEIPWHVKPDWPWTNRKYVLALPGTPEEIQYVEIDPSRRMADIQWDNNRIVLKDYLKKKSP